MVVLLIGLSVMALFAAVLRWASSLDTDKAHRKDYGLLREVAKVPSTRAARVVEERLQGAGVRATTVPDPEGNGLIDTSYITNRAPQQEDCPLW